MNDERIAATDRLRTLLVAGGIRISLLDLVREADAARLFGVTGRTLRAWRHAGTGPQATKIGGGYSYSVAALAAYVWKDAEETGKVSVAEAETPVRMLPTILHVSGSAANESRTNGQCCRSDQHRASAAQQQDGE